MVRRSPRLAAQGRAKSASPKKRSPQPKRRSGKPKKLSPAQFAKKAHWSRGIRSDAGLTDSELQARIARARAIIAKLSKSSPSDLMRTSKRKANIRNRRSYAYWLSQNKLKGGKARRTKGHRMTDLVDPLNEAERFDWGHTAQEVKEKREAYEAYKADKARKAAKARKSPSPKRKAAKSPKRKVAKSPTPKLRKGKKASGSPKAKAAKRKSPVAVARPTRTRRAPSRLGF